MASAGVGCASVFYRLDHLKASMVRPNGDKWWRLKYRLGSKEKRMSLGVYPEVTRKETRQRRDDARKLIANNVGPSEHRKPERRSRNSVSPTASSWSYGSGSTNTPGIRSRVMPAELSVDLNEPCFPG